MASRGDSENDRDPAASRIITERLALEDIDYNRDDSSLATDHSNDAKITFDELKKGIP